RRRPDAMFLVADAFTSMHRKRLIEFAATHRIPAMYEFSFLVRDGGLMSYGPSPEDGFRRAALYIDRIFKGAKPADLPAEQPTRPRSGTCRTPKTATSGPIPCCPTGTCCPAPASGPGNR